MNTTRTLVLASVIAAAMVFGGVLGATAMSRSGLTPALAALTAASPSPGAFKSNEDPTHEKSESAAQEAAENNGTFHPGGPGGPGPGHSNEAASHESGESAAREAQESSGTTATP